MFKVAKYLPLLLSCFLGLLFSPCVAIAASITLAWDSSPSNEIVGYRIYYGKKSQRYTYPPIDVGNVSQYTIDGLNENKVYYFALAVLTRDGRESGFSSEVSTLQEFTGIARLLTRQKRFDICEMQQVPDESIEVSLAFNYLRPNTFTLDTDDVRFSCYKGTVTKYDDGTLDAQCIQKGPFGIFPLFRWEFSGEGNVLEGTPLAMIAEVYSLFNRECPHYVLEMDELFPEP